MDFPAALVPLDREIGIFGIVFDTADSELAQSPLL